MKQVIMHMRTYCRRWIKSRRKGGASRGEFVRQLTTYVDPGADPVTAGEIYDEVIREMGDGGLWANPEFELMHDLFGDEPLLFASQPPDSVNERRDHAGGAAPHGWDPEADERVVVPIAEPFVQFPFDDVCPDEAQDQRRPLVGLLQLILWAHEPLETGFKNISTLKMTHCKFTLLQLFISPMSLGNPTLAQLGARLGTSRQFLGKLVRDFKARYPSLILPWFRTPEACALLAEAHQKKTDAPSTHFPPPESN